MAPDIRARRETRCAATDPAASAGSHDTVDRTAASSAPPKETKFSTQSRSPTRRSYLRTTRETRCDATEPASSAGSHDTVGLTTSLFGPPKETTTASAWSDHSVSGLSYISPANVGFDPSAPYERPMAPTPGSLISPQPSLQPMPFNDRVLFSDLLPSNPPSSCDFGTPKDFGTDPKFTNTPVLGPSPPFVPKTRGRARFQARCETASPSTDIWTRFCRDFTTPDICDVPPAPEEVGGGATEQARLRQPTSAERAGLSEPPPTEQTPRQPTPTEHTPRQPATTEQADFSESAPAEQIHYRKPATPEQVGFSEPATIEQEHVDAFTNWSLYAVPGNLLADFVSGVLQFSQLDDDGNPLFAKNTGTKTPPQQMSSTNHKDVTAVHVSKEEAHIFVSMDQLRREIAQLQEHDEAMEREADKAHQEKARLELQLQEVRGTCRKSSSDSAIGSDSDDDIRKRTQAEKLKRMQKRLDEANNLANSQHVHIDALTAERDELIKECHLAHEHKKLLTEKNQLQTEQNKALSKENQDLKYQMENASQYFMSLENEFKHHKSENERLRQQISQLQEQNGSLRKTRMSHSEQIKNLQSELEATREQFTHDREQLTQDITVLVNKNKEIRKQRDKFENCWESLQKEHMVIHHRMCNRTREESTANSINSSTGTVVRHRPSPSIHIKRVAPSEETTTDSINSSTGAAVRHRPPPPVQVKKPSVQIKGVAPRASPASPVKEEHTMRPVQDEYTNMKFLISTTEMELAGLEQELLQKTLECKNMHKGYNRRVWEKLHNEKVALEKAIHQKSDILYHQFDLLEGIRRNAMKA